jgi:hypothetical protein
VEQELGEASKAFRLNRKRRSNVGLWTGGVDRSILGLWEIGEAETAFQRFSWKASDLFSKVLCIVPTLHTRNRIYS